MRTHAVGSATSKVESLLTLPQFCSRENKKRIVSINPEISISWWVISFRGTLHTPIGKGMGNSRLQHRFGRRRSQSGFKQRAITVASSVCGRSLDEMDVKPLPLPVLLPLVAPRIEKRTHPAGIDVSTSRRRVLRRLGSRSRRRRGPSGISRRLGSPGRISRRLGGCGLDGYYAMSARALLSRYLTTALNGEKTGLTGSSGGRSRRGRSPRSVRRRLGSCTRARNQRRDQYCSPVDCSAAGESRYRT